LKPKRIGLFGGSFDPPHLAHLAMARLARDNLALNEVRWVPAGQPWQKAGRTMASAADRTAMVRLMIDGEPGFVLDDVEIRRAGPSYSIDTVRTCAAAEPGALLYLIVGQDQYARLHTWHQWRDLLRRVTLAVAGRAGASPMPSSELISVPHRIEQIDLPNMPLSSTHVRERAQRGDAVAPLVGDAVAGYIETHALYRADTRS
jgi:nicotinate-nucleotide adenylyltransferase